MKMDNFTSKWHLKDKKWRVQQALLEKILFVQRAQQLKIEAMSQQIKRKANNQLLRSNQKRYW